MATEPKKHEKVTTTGPRQDETGPTSPKEKPTKQPIQAPEAIDQTPTAVAAEPGNSISGAN